MNSIDKNTTDNSVNAILNTNYINECESDYDSSDDNMVASFASNTLLIEPKNTSLQNGGSSHQLLQYMQYFKRILKLLTTPLLHNDYRR